MRNLMVKILGEDFILLARARGLPERNIILGHAFRTLLPPLLTIFLLSLPGIVSGAVITETVFSLHGVGRFLLEAVTGHDYPAAGASFFPAGPAHRELQPSVGPALRPDRPPGAHGKGRGR